MVDTVVTVDDGASALVAPQEGIHKTTRDFVESGPEYEAEVDSAKPQPEDKSETAGSEDTKDTAKEDSDEPVKPKRPGGLTRKLTRLEQENADLRAQLQRGPEPAKNQTSQPIDAEGKPRLDQFNDYESYTQALVDWRVAEADKNRQQQALKTEIANKAKSYQAKAEEARTRYEDFDDVINDYDGPISPHISRALVESDIGPDIAYHLGHNIDLLEKLNTMDPINVGREIGKIEAMITAKTTKPAAAKVTKAPAPVNPVGTSKIASTVDPDNMSYEEYKVWRRSNGGR